ncbi:hypothetical protein QN277_000243 [Acacia crassicarpa]|nr:hypothetical protein QN277_000243 [Acacia crassicarpa]
MPEASIGLFPDVGASYFLSRLHGYFGEYLGLTGRRLNGEEMVKCGLATHFVPSKKLNLLENALRSVTTSDISTINALIDNFSEIAYLKEDSPLKRLDTINKCFSKGTAEEIVLSLEKEMEVEGGDKWIGDALNYMRASCPTGLKIWLRSVREGRVQSIEECLSRDYNIASHFLRRTVSNDFYEGSRAKLFDKDNKAMWNPPKLELVTEEMVNQFFAKVEDENWECLKLPHRSNILGSKL